MFVDGSTTTHEFQILWPIRPSLLSSHSPGSKSSGGSIRHSLLSTFTIFDAIVSPTLITVMAEKLTNRFD